MCALLALYRHFLVVTALKFLQAGHFHGFIATEMAMADAALLSRSLPHPALSLFSACFLSSTAAVLVCGAATFCLLTGAQ